MVLRLRQGSLVQEVNKCLLGFLVVSVILAVFAGRGLRLMRLRKQVGLGRGLLVLVQIDLLWLYFKKCRMLLLWFCLAIVLQFLFLMMRSCFMIMECNGAFWDISCRALLRAWFTRFPAFLLFSVQVEMKVVSRAYYRILCNSLVTELATAIDLIQICR